MLVARQLFKEYEVKEMKGDRLRRRELFLAIEVVVIGGGMVIRRLLVTSEYLLSAARG